MIFFMFFHLIFLQISSRLLELESDVEFYKTICYGLLIIILILAVVVFLQRRRVKKLIIKIAKLDPDDKDAKKALKKPPAKPPVQPKTAPDVLPVSKGMVPPQKLPDPGLLFKFAFQSGNGEQQLEKYINIGQAEGTIKTYSTEIIDNHLSLFLKIIESREKDIYDLPDVLIEEYMVDIRRDGKTLIYYPGLTAYEEMGSRQRIYIRAKEDSEAEDITVKTLDPKNPIRFRIGDRLNQDNKFINGFFEFHLFTQDKKVKTKAGITKIEKVFVVRLYKIYPGFDTGAPNDEGLYPMIDPFVTR
jgi:hypothetical protein